MHEIIYLAKDSDINDYIQKKSRGLARCVALINALQKEPALPEHMNNIKIRATSQITVQYHMIHALRSPGNAESSLSAQARSQGL